MVKPTFSSKLRNETRRGYHSSLAVVLLVVFITVTVFLFFLSIKGVFNNNKNNTVAQPTDESSKELDEVKIEPQNQAEQKYIVKSGDTLYSIGIKFSINWKDIAKANNLEEPYSLSTGQELKIPKSEKNN